MRTRLPLRCTSRILNLNWARMPPTRFLRANSTYGAEFGPEEVAVSNLLYNVSQKGARESKHIICALVTNEPGVLSRVSGVLAGRGFNIDSLVVSATDVRQLSRMTIVLKGGADVEQARKQLEDMVQVWAAVVYPPGSDVIERELVLIKVKSPQSIGALPASLQSKIGVATSESDVLNASLRRQALVELAKLFSGRPVDVTNEHVTIELTANPLRIDAFIELVRPFGISECARSGTLAMVRGAMSGLKVQMQADTSAVDDTMMPPG